MLCPRCQAATAATARYCSRCGRALTEDSDAFAAFPDAAADRFRAYIEHAPHGVFIADEQGRYVEVNPAACRITGYDEAELLELSIPDLLPPEALSRGLESFLRVRDTGRDGIELPYVGKGGRRGWWSVDAVKLSETRFLGFVTDVTDRVIAEQAVERERDFSRRLLDAAPVIVLWLDLDGRIRHFNRFLEELSGYRLDEVYGCDWFETFLPERDRDRIRTLFRTATTAAPTCGNRNPILTRHGEEREIQWYDRRLYDDEGRTVGLLAVGQDITDLLRSEAAVRLKDRAIAASINGIAIADLTGRLTYVNPAFLQMWGYDREEEVLGRSPTEFWKRPESAADIMHTLLAGNGWFGELTAKRRDGSFFESQLSAALIRDADGRPTHMLGSFIDVTERKQYRDRLEQSEVKLRAIFDSEPECVKLIDADGRLIDMNRAGLEMIEAASLDEARRTDLLELILPAYHERFRADVAEVFCGGRTCLEFEIIGLCGTHRWVEQRAVGLADPADPGRIAYALSVTRDVTARKRAEQELVEAHHRLRSVLDSLFGFVGLYALDGTLIEANRAPLEAAGLTRAEVLGRPFWETYWWSYSPAVQSRLREALRRAAQGELVRYETDVRIKDGAFITIDVMFGPLRNADGAVVNLIGFAVDVTERKRVEADLRAGEDRLRILIENTPAGVAMLDRNLCYLACSRRWISDYGLGDRDVIGRSHYEVFPEIPERWKEIHRRCLAGVGERCEEDSFLRADGTMQYVRWEIQPWRNAAGDVGGLCFFTEDVTERKQAEKTIREQLRLLGDVFRYSFDGLVLLDANYNFIRVNQAYADFCRRDVAEFAGRNHFEMYPSSLKDEFDEAVRKREPYRTSARPFTFPDHPEWGVTYWDLAMVPIYDSDDRLELILFTLRDVTEHQRSLEQLRLHSHVLLSMTEAVCFVDKQGRIQFTNQALDVLYGYAPGELIGRPVTDLNDYTPEENQRVIAEIMTAMQTDGVWSGEFRNRRKNGGVFWTAASISSLKHQDAPYFVSVQQDVTEKKRGEEQTASLRNQLAHAGRIAVIGEMASGLAHELNQPLAALQLYVGSAVDVAANLDAPQLNRHLQRIGEQAERAADIVRGMRAFAKRESARRASVDLNQLIREVLTLAQHDLRKHEVSLQLNLDEGLPPVQADAIQIQQVLMNLIRNAVDAMNSDDCRRRTLLLYSEVVPGGVGVGVVDSGCGIRPEMVGKLFQPFHTDKPSGLGLGLAISRTLVEAHGGQIEARPHLPTGTTFYFTLRN